MMCICLYECKYYKIVDKEKDTFWLFPEPLYKSKHSVKKEGLFSRIWHKIKR